MPGLVPPQRRPDPIRAGMPGAARAGHGAAEHLAQAAQALEAAPRVAQLAGLGRALNVPKPNRVATPVIQGYFLANPSAGAGTLHSHSPAPRFQPHSTQLHYPAQTAPVAAGRYRVSDDRSMAVQNTTNEPKEFFAKNSVFDAANTSLAAVGSDVRLRKAGGQVSFGGNTLAGIGPTRAGQPPVLAGFPTLWSHICISLTNKLIGGDGTFHENVVLEDAHSGARSSFGIEPSGQGAPEINRLAHNLTASPDDPLHPQGRLDEARTAATTGIERKPGKAYGEASHAGTLGAEARLGVNRYARPEVGEGFATFTIPSGSPKALDFATTGKARERGGSWGYHHAAVVARSSNGHDWITLENYNRDPQTVDKFLPRVREKYRVEANAKSKALQKQARQQGKPPLSKLQMRAALDTWLAEQHGAASAYLNGLVGPQQAPKNSLWFFRMYGSGAGQSFHEEQAASGAYLNPMTVRIRHDPLRKPRVKLANFRKGAVEALSQVQWQAARTPLTGLVTGVSGIIAQIDAAPPGRTNQQARATLAAVQMAYANWITNHFVPRLVLSLNAARRGLPPATSTTLGDLRTQSLQAEPAPGKWARFKNYAGGGDLHDAVRKASLSRVKSLIISAPLDL